jgi:acetyltransferase
LHLLQSLRVWPILTGARGRTPLNVDRLLETLIRFSYLVSECPEVIEIDVNPLLVTPENVVALDARLVVDRRTPIKPRVPYAHLAIRPYPEEYRRQSMLRNGQSVLLRVISPEDEPLWHEMIASCSPESIHARFHGMIKGGVHFIAARFCTIDYDRELAIVAEVEVDARRRLAGVARLAADADHRDAEFTVLVADGWQGQGLGSLLADYCLEVCQPWGISRVWAVTTVDNQRMLHIFRQRGFEQVQPVYGEVHVQKWLTPRA